MKMKKLAALLSAMASIAAIMMAPTAASADVVIQATCYRTVNVWSSAYGDNGWPIPSAGSTASSTNCGMAQGANSAAVAHLQRSLNYCYGESLVVDSDFGPATKAALMRAQSDEGITVDGIYGPQTRDHLWWWGGGACDKVYLPITIA